MNNTILNLCFAAILVASIASQTQAFQANETVEQWIQRSSVTLDLESSTWDRDALGSFTQRLQSIRVLGLGEATHGQHEVFELKRKLTMYLIRHEGWRTVAYEASSSALTAAQSYIDGNSDDRNVATSALGMLIWQIEENGALLDDLRAWNRECQKEDRVELIGIDAQDPQAVIGQFERLVGASDPQLIKESQAAAEKSRNLMASVMQGKNVAWKSFSDEVDALVEKLKSKSTVAKATEYEYRLRLLELQQALTIYQSPSNRDLAMAKLLLRQLEDRGPKSRCVVWAHNGHVQRSPLRYLGSEDLAMGGHIAKSLGDKYYAIGVAFGAGEFQANAQTEGGRWGFRRYRLSAAPLGSLESTLSCQPLPCYLLDLRDAPVSPSVLSWLNAGHGQRWYGGYKVPENYDELARDAAMLLPTFPRVDFDGIVYVAKTTAATPIDSKLIIEKP